MRLFDQNGIETPHIARLAQQGITFTSAFSNGPVCSVARSTLISGSYAPRTGTQFHRKIVQVPMPAGVEMFPAYLRRAGYYTTNRAKEDYNFIKPEGVWDESSNKATWRNRAPGQPFFHVHNIATTHESRLFFTEEEMEVAMATAPKDDFDIHPYHPQTPTFYYTNLRYRQKIQDMDQEVGEVIAQLEADGLLNHTFIFYFGDHGGVLPGSKGYLKEIGLHVPLVLYVPPQYQELGPLKPGAESDAFVSFIDFGPTVLALAEVQVPKKLDGKPFCGRGMTPSDLASKDVTYSYADRFDEKYDMVRAVRKGKYKYIRNYQPYHQDALWNNYRYKQLGYQEWLGLFQAGKLNQNQAQFFLAKQAEELYDLEADPFELYNLAEQPTYRETLLDMRKELKDWVLGMPDLSFFPEYALIQQGAINNPEAFAKQHKKSIKAYLGIADLMLEDFNVAHKKLEKSLTATDPFRRYWGLIVCLSFGEKAQPLLPLLKEIAAADASAINRVYATGYLGLVKEINPVEPILVELYQTTDATESLLLLNEIVWLKDLHGFEFSIDPSQVPETVRADGLVKNRLSYFTE